MRECVKYLKTALPGQSIDEHVDVLLRRLGNPSRERRVADRNNFNLTTPKQLPGCKIGLAIFPNSKAFFGRHVLKFLSDTCQPSQLLEIIDDGVIGKLPKRCNRHHLRAKDDIGRINCDFIHSVGDIMPELFQSPSDRFDNFLVAFEAMRSWIGYYAMDQIVGAHCPAS